MPLARLSLIVLMSATSVAAAPPASITRDQALTLPAPELADAVFRQLATTVRTVSRPTHVGLPAPDSRLRHLQFATAPYGHGYGLCEARLISVGFTSDQPESPNGHSVEVRADAIHIERVYKALSVAEAPNWTDSDRLRLEERCRREGPVIPENSSDFDQRAFFTFSGELGAERGVRTLDRIFREAIAGTHPALSCRQVRSYGCRDPRAELAPLVLTDLISLSVDRDEGNPLMNRFRAMFHSPTPGRSEVVYVEALVELAEPWLASPRIVRLGPATVDRNVLIRD